MKLWLLLFFVVGTVWAGPKTLTTVDCWPEKLVIHPEKVEVTPEQLRTPENAFSQLLDRIEANRSQQSLVVLVRPGSIKLYRSVRNLMGTRQIDVSFELVDADFSGEWREPAKPKPAAPPTALPAPGATTYPEDAELRQAKPVTDCAALLAELTAKRQQVRDYQATSVILGSGIKMSKSESYLAEGRLSRAELSLDSTMLYDGETTWHIRGDLMMKLPSRGGAYICGGVPDLARLLAPAEGSTVRTTANWVVIEQRRTTSVGVAKQAGETAIPPPALEKRTFVERSWVSRTDGLRYREEKFAETGALVSGWRFTDVRLNVGLEPALFRPDMTGKLVWDPSQKMTPELMEAMRKSSKVPEMSLKPKVGGPALVVAQQNLSMVMFECRGDELFPVEKEALEAQAKRGAVGPPIADAWYEVEPLFLMMGILALKPRPDVHGEGVELLAKPESPFRAKLAQLDRAKHHLVFLVRDDSFLIYRHAQALAEEAGFQTSWELLGAGESIKLGIEAR